VADAKDYKDEIGALGKVLAALADLEEDGQQFVLRSAMDRLGHSSMSVSGGGNGPTTKGPAGAGGSPAVHTAGSHSGGSLGKPKQFLDDKLPKTDVERVGCLAFYLAHSREMPHFKTADITALNTEAAQKPLSNAAYAVGNAQQSGLLTNAGKRGHKQITSFGEKVVNALPDREAVAAVVAAGKAQRRRRKKTAKTKVARK
jgi:hypothetical protein